jgi:hypothetical protein
LAIRAAAFSDGDGTDTNMIAYRLGYNHTPIVNPAHAGFTLDVSSIFPNANGHSEY